MGIIKIYKEIFVSGIVSNSTFEQTDKSKLFEVLSYHGCIDCIKMANNKLYISEEILKVYI